VPDYYLLEQALFYLSELSRDTCNTTLKELGCLLVMQQTLVIAKECCGEHVRSLRFYRRFDWFWMTAQGRACFPFGSFLQW
jgi:hypothetical protein